MLVIINKNIIIITIIYINFNAMVKPLHKLYYFIIHNY